MEQRADVIDLAAFRRQRAVTEDAAASDAASPAQLELFAARELTPREEQHRRRMLAFLKTTVRAR